MKTIEERAKEYAPERNKFEYLFPAMRTTLIKMERKAYIAGAQEQKVIDDAKLLKLKSAWEKEAQITHDDEANYKQGYHDAIEKACEWIKENFEYYVDVEVSSYYMYGDKFIGDFRKAMEE